MDPVKASQAFADFSASTALDALSKHISTMPKGQLLEKSVELTLYMCMPGGISRYLGGMVGIQEAATVSQAINSITTALQAEYAHAVELAGTNMTMRQICAPFSNSIYQNLKTVETTAKIAQEEGLGMAKNLVNFAAQEPEFAVSELLGKSIGERISSFSKRFNKKKQGTLVECGGTRRVKPSNDVEAWDSWAPKQYDTIRQCTTDIDAIAKNTGLPQQKIARIKHHLFFDDTHKLDTKIGRFDPSPDQAAAWDRLVKGDFVENDLKMLEHEYFESKFEKLFDTKYRTAHARTEQSGRSWNPSDTQ